MLECKSGVWWCLGSNPGQGRCSQATGEAVRAGRVGEKCQPRSLLTRGMESRAFPISWAYLPVWTVTPAKCGQPGLYPKGPQCSSDATPT